MKSHPPRCHCCEASPVRMSWAAALKHILQIFGRASPSKLWSTSFSRKPRQYPVAGISMGSSSSNLSPNSPTMPPPSNLPNNNASAQGQASTGVTTSTIDAHFVVFGIKDLQGFHGIENIQAPSHLTDASFFEELRARHKKHRWCFQRWLSPYVFRYCRFVQVGDPSP